MYETDATDGRIDDDYREPSPSTGPEETAIILDAVEGQSHTVDCSAPDCDRDGEELAVITDEDVKRGVRCRIHAKDFLGVSS